MLNGSAVAPPAAIGDDQCFSQYSQLYIEQGAYILDPELNLTSLGAKASVDECAAACESSCQYFSFVYSDDTRTSSNGTCYVRNTPEGVAIAKRLFYKMIPTQDMSGQSVGGRSVSTGIYTKWLTVADEVEQGFDVGNPPPPGSSSDACLAACDNDASCVLVYYDVSAAARKCVLKAGGAAPRIRTAIHGVPGSLVKAQGGDGAACAACAADSDCLFDHCNSTTKTCIAYHCYNGVRDADESCVDGGGADCEACPSAPTPGEWQGCSGWLGCYEGSSLVLGLNLG
jgi:hypothetical protein